MTVQSNGKHFMQLQESWKVYVACTVSTTPSHTIYPTLFLFVQLTFTSSHSCFFAFLRTVHYKASPCAHLCALTYVLISPSILSLTVWVGRSEGGFCAYHVHGAYKQAQAKRGEFQAGSVCNHLTAALSSLLITVCVLMLCKLYMHSQLNVSCPSFT